MSETLDIKYTITHHEGEVFVFDLKIDKESMTLIDAAESAPPAWAQLEVSQCGHCPLNSAETPVCPVARNISGSIDAFSKITSYEKVHLEVVTEERTISQETSAQRAVSSLLGLLMATSACPHTAFFKPMARFHLPLASEEETIFRSTSNYLLAQYFKRVEGGQPDFDLSGLEEIYRNVEKLNLKIAERVRMAADEDAALNAIVILDFFAKMLPDMIEDSLDYIKYIFKPYLDAQQKAEGSALASSGQSVRPD